MAEFVFSAVEWEALFLTLKLALFTVAILFAFGLPLAWWLARYQGPLQSVFEALITLPLVLPPTVLGFYLLVAFSPDTFLGQAWLGATGTQFVFSFAGILFGSVVYSLPFVVQPLLQAFRTSGHQIMDTSQTLGLSKTKAWFYVLLPAIRPSMISAATLGFAHTLGEFGLILMIGGNIPGETQVVSIALFNQVEMLNYAQAHTLAAFLLSLSFISLVLLYKFNVRHRPRMGW
ncbi:molybdate ABC transporter permease subunit [Glaciecola siphonariae]|uniref:Molybdenum transport system permease n=1 Tax=Glaciecola siphonariae TaxID=521012 RepID=A0ABV9LZE8_9ALTE